MWGIQKTEGYICIDQDYCRLLKLANDGKTWTSLSVVNVGGSLKENLVNSIKQFFRHKAKVNVVLSDKSRTVFMNFPSNLDEEAIIKNLDLNKKDYFYTTDELAYAIKRHKNPVNREQTTVAISYCPKETIRNLTALYKASGIKMGRLTTASDCLLGTLQRQFPKIKNDTVNLVIQVAYSNVIFMITQGYTPIRVEALFTGNLYDLETRLVNTFGIEPIEALRTIHSPSTSGYDGAANIVNTDRMELITRLGGLISELRGTNLLSNDSKIYVSYPIINEPELSYSVSERFGFEVVQLTGLKENEPISTNDTLNHAWLVGTDYNGIPDIYAENKEHTGHLETKEKLMWVIIALCVILPIIITKYELYKTDKGIKDIQANYNEMLQLKEELQNTKEERRQNLNSIKGILKDLDVRGEFTKSLRFMVEKMPEECRLESISFNKQKKETTLSGYALDRETALRDMDILSSLKNFKKIQIFYDEEKINEIKFHMIIPLMIE